MTAKNHPELDLPPSGAREKCVDRKGVRYVLGAADWELDAILNRPLNHKQRLTGILDLASRGASRQDLCFIVECLREFMAGKTVKRTDEQIAVMLFGKARKLVRVKEIYRALNYKHDHVYGLIESGVIPLARNSEQRRGPGGSAVVEWSALVKFISDRRES